MSPMGTGEMLGWLVDHDIAPHIPVWDKSERDGGTFSRADFIHDAARDVDRAGRQTPGGRGCG